MAEVDLRLLRYFVAVAEEGSFTRAAERLPMAQGALSRAVRSLEAMVGTPLLVRDHRGSTATEAGRVLLCHARDLEQRAAAAIRLARRAGASTPRLTVVAPGYEVAALEGLLRSYHRADPPVAAEALVVDRHRPADRVREGIADVGLVRVPCDEPGLASAEVFAEPRVVLLPEHHPLATRTGLELAQLRGAPVIRPGADHEGLLYRPPSEWRPGPTIGDTAQVRALVRLDQAIAFVPASVAPTLVGAGLRAVRVLDCPPATLRIAWREGNTSPGVAGLVRHATLNPGDVAGLAAPGRSPAGNG